MPVTITLTIQDADIAKFAAAILGGSQPAITPNVVPPAAEAEAPAAAAPATTGKKKGANKAAEPAPAPEPEPQQEAPTVDLVTPEQLAEVSATADGTSADDQRAQLTDFYLGMGHAKADVQNLLTSMNDEELKGQYAEYLARILVNKDDGTPGEFTADFDTPYIATRIDDGKPVLHWVKGGVTMTAEECEAAKLADPNAPKPAPAKAAPLKRPALKK